MICVAPSTKDTDTAAPEKRLWDAAEQALPAPHFAKTVFGSVRLEGLLGLTFLRFAEARVAIQRAKLETVTAKPGGDEHDLQHGPDPRLNHEPVKT